jgi:ArsR family transcriptional regulator, cadmium/lead-responsive transcriptional repressor
MTRAGPTVRARFFRSLADPSRLAILDALRERELSAGEVADAAGLTLSNASRHLACLRDCGLVESRQAWRHVYYRLAGQHVTHLLEEADLVLQLVAERVAACARPEMEGR